MAFWQAAQARRARRLDEDAAKPKPRQLGKKPNRGGLTASEQKTLKDIEGTIQEAEEQVEQCRRALDDVETASDHVETQKRWDDLEVARKKVEELYALWEELESKAN